jgi:hypothetical protein
VPSNPLIVLYLVPVSTTVAPINGSFVSKSIILPLNKNLSDGLLSIAKDLRKKENINSRTKV